MSDESRIYEDAADVTEEEIAEFEERADEIAAEVADIELVEEDDEVKLAGLEAMKAAGEDIEAASTYRVISLIGRFCSPNGNWGTRSKDMGCIQHWNGPATPARAWQDPVSWIKFISDLHAQPGRFAPNWRFDGAAYHSFVFGDVVYRVRNYQANLPHCGNLTYNHRALGLHVAIGTGQRANAATLRTLTARNRDHLAAMKLGRGSCRGHSEVGSSACPGTLMADFVRPFRAGQNPGGNALAPAPSPTPAPAPAPGKTVHRFHVTDTGQILALSDPEGAKQAAADLQRLGVKFRVDPPLT